MREKPRSKIDLHLHSTFSDGLKTPAELCRMADERRMELIALCDHDTLCGVKALGAGAEEVRLRRAEAGTTAPFTAIGGIELSSGAGGRLHLLGYAPDADDPALSAWLSSAVEDRRRRAEVILDNLNGLGVSLDGERAALLACPQVGRAHIARAMVRLGFAGSINQAFERYLAEGRPAYAPRGVLKPADALRLLRDAGAVTSLAHPVRLGLSDTALAALVCELRDAGLQAIEAYHPSATRAQAAMLARMARRIGLMVTGGSDYHGDGSAHMGCLPLGWSACADDVSALLSALAKQ